MMLDKLNKAVKIKKWILVITAFSILTAGNLVYAETNETTSQSASDELSAQLAAEETEKLKREEKERLAQLLSDEEFQLNYGDIQKERLSKTYSMVKYLTKNLSSDDWGSITYGEGWICLGVPGIEKMNEVDGLIEQYEISIRQTKPESYSPNFTDAISVSYTFCRYTGSDLKKIEKSIQNSSIYKNYKAKGIYISTSINELSGVIFIETETRYPKLEKWLKEYEYKDIIFYRTKDVKLNPN